MASERVQLDDQKIGNETKQPMEFPIPSLRQFLLPDTLVYVHWFRTRTEQLEKAVNQWITAHKVIIAAVSSPVIDGDFMSISVTYVSPDGRPVVDV